MIGKSNPTFSQSSETYSKINSAHINLAYLYTLPHEDKPSRHVLQCLQAMGLTGSSGFHSVSETIA